MAQHPTDPECADGLAERINRWRASGADRVEPARFHRIAALARRAQAQSGEVRSVLDRRLATLLTAHGERLDRAGPGRVDANPSRPITPGPLAGLVQSLGRPAAAQVELKALSQHRGDWARLSIARQLSRSQQQAPENPGPLNSQRLMLRALQLMQSLSPAYLGRFVSQVEALLWLEQAGAGPAVVAKPARRAVKAKAGRSKPG